MNNPVDHWNPGWNFVMNPRAQAGGNRALQPVVARQERAAPAPAQNRRHNRPVRRENRNVDRFMMSRDDQERIETVAKKRYQMRTAVEFDPRESICWAKIDEKIDSTTHNFPGDGDNEGVSIPDDAEIATMLRSEMQVAAIKETRELLENFGASEFDLRTALRNLEVHLTTNACEYNEIENVASDLIRHVDKLTEEIDELEEIMCRIDKIRMY